MGKTSVNPSKEIALHEYVQSEMGKPFKYGTHDCPLFAAGVLDIFAGTSHREELTGMWHDQKSAWRYMRKNGDIHTNLVNAGCVPVVDSHIQTGDFLCMEQKLAHEKKWHSVGVCIGSKAAILTEEDGVLIVAMSEVPNMTRAVRYV